MGIKVRLAHPRMQFFDDDGNVLSGGKLYTYENGTTTNKTTYTDKAGATPHANPIILDSRGEAEIFWDGLYSIKLTDSSDVQIDTADDFGQGALEGEERTAPQAVTHNMASDADYTLTSAQEGYGRIIITDTLTNLTASRNIVCSTDEKGYYLQNDTVQELTFKTSSGTGIIVAPGERRHLICDGTNVVRSVEGGTDGDFLSGDFEYIHDDECAAATSFDIDANIGTAFESVGPTGSGATNIWTALNVVPLDAKFIKVKIITTLAGATNGDTYQAIVSARKTGSSAALAANQRIAFAAFLNRTGASEFDANVNSELVPVDSSNRFDLYFTESGTSPNAGCTMYLVGWIR